MLDVAAKSQAELTGGISRINAYNVAAILDHMVWVVESGIAEPMQIGISTPYAAQVVLLAETIRQALQGKAKSRLAGSSNRYCRFVALVTYLYTAIS